MNQSEEKNLNIAIVGAGIIGISLAIELRLKGYQVDLIDKDQIATNCCSIGNTGHIGSDIFPIAQPDLIQSLPKLLFQPHSPLKIPLSSLIKQIPWLFGFIQSAYGKKFKQATKAMHYLANRCLDDTFDLYQKAGIESEVKKTGCLFLYRNSKEFNQAHNQWQLKKKMGVDFQVYQKDQLLKIEPALQKNQFEFGVLTHHWAKVTDPKEVLKKLFSFAQNIGVNFIQANLKNITSTVNPAKNNYLELILLSKNKKSLKQNYHKVVIASGIGSKTIANQINEKLPIAAARGYAITFSSPDIKLKQPILIRPMGLSVSSLNSGFRFGGLVELTDENHPINEKIYDYLLKVSKQFFNVSGKSIHYWMNSRPATFDSAPILSQSQKFEQLFYSTAHSHWGLSFAASSAKILADLISKNSANLPSEYQLYSKNRF